jgi:hypothetical protein
LYPGGVLSCEACVTSGRLALGEVLVDLPRFSAIRLGSVRLPEHYGARVMAAPWYADDGVVVKVKVNDVEHDMLRGNKFTSPKMTGSEMLS